MMPLAGSFMAPSAHCVCRSRRRFKRYASKAAALAAHAPPYTAADSAELPSTALLQAHGCGKAACGRASWRPSVARLAPAPLRPLCGPLRRRPAQRLRSSCSGRCALRAMWRRLRESTPLSPHSPAQLKLATETVDEQLRNSHAVPVSRLHTAFACTWCPALTCRVLVLAPACEQRAVTTPVCCARDQDSCMSVHGRLLPNSGSFAHEQRRGAPRGSPQRPQLTQQGSALFVATAALGLRAVSVLRVPHACCRTSRRRIARKPSSGTPTGTTLPPNLRRTMLHSASRHATRARSCQLATLTRSVRVMCSTRPLRP